jgi:hypothetical protein
MYLIKFKFRYCVPFTWISEKALSFLFNDTKIIFTLFFLFNYLLASPSQCQVVAGDFIGVCLIWHEAVGVVVSFQGPMGWSNIIMCVYVYVSNVLQRHLSIYSLRSKLLDTFNKCLCPKLDDLFFSCPNLNLLLEI